MGLVIDVKLQSSHYDAASEDRAVAEWPPHPARVFCALVASAQSSKDHDVLRWLEGQPPPDVYAAPRIQKMARPSYVVTNAVKSGGGSQFHPGRTNALRSRATTVVSTPNIGLVWPDAAPDASQAERLDRLAKRVPYLGRSTGVALLSCHLADDRPRDPDLAHFEPARPGERGNYDLRVPFPGYLEALTDQYEHNGPSWEVSQTRAYLRRDNHQLQGPEPEKAGFGWQAADFPSAYTDIIIMQFEQFRPDGSLAPLLTDALRRAVMSATSDPLPAALHGHETASRPHVAFLALPDVGHPHADGRLLGMAVAIPELADHERRAIVRGLLGARRQGQDEHPDARVFGLHVPQLGEMTLAYRPGLIRPWALHPSRWRRGSQEWVSVTPVVLDRYPRHGDIEAEVARSCLLAGLPQPDGIVTSTSPLLPGAIRLRPHQLPRRARGRVYRHVRLHFPHRVAGPVLLGAGRYLGVGLLAPVNGAEYEQEGGRI